MNSSSTNMTFTIKPSFVSHSDISVHSTRNIWNISSTEFASQSSSIPFTNGNFSHPRLSVSTSAATTTVSTTERNQFLGLDKTSFITVMSAVAFLVVVMGIIICFCCCKRRRYRRKSKKISFVINNHRKNTSEQPTAAAVFYGEEDDSDSISEEVKKDSPFSKVYRSTIRATVKKFKFQSTQRRNEITEYYKSHLNSINDVIDEEPSCTTSYLDKFDVYNDTSPVDISVAYDGKFPKRENERDADGTIDNDDAHSSSDSSSSSSNSGEKDVEESNVREPPENHRKQSDNKYIGVPEIHIYDEDDETSGCHLETNKTSYILTTADVHYNSESPPNNVTISKNAHQDKHS